MRFYRIKTILLTILTIVFIQNAFGQMMSKGSGLAATKDMFGPALFLYKTAIFQSEQFEEKDRLDVYVAFANDILQFVKEREGIFSAEYELLISVFDKKKNLVGEYSEIQKIEENNFNLTNNRRLKNRHKFSFHLSPAVYELVINLTDHDTQKSLKRKKKISKKNFKTGRSMLSDVLFGNLLLLNSEGEIERFDTNLTGKFFNPDSSFWAYFEIYPKNPADSINVTYSILDANSDAVTRKTITLLPDKPIVPYLLDISKYVNMSGHYSLIINCHQEKQTTEKAKFSVVWRNTEFTKMNIEQSIKTMREFIPIKEYRYLMEAPDSVKKAYYKKFWEERDPTPESKKNELLDEFNRRVEFSNNYFSVHALKIEGWRTDRGKIYLKYGTPSEVERNMEQINLPPFEIWYYHKHQRRFVFEDKSGVGDFKLVRVE
ncbi:hypothetical protein B6I21_01855 [candidate division KSB1 bacterium 4572_119]|nr:MAG: hypothetical protein B6I21_01855 [candidate division KSB1 bacterium 4572_119]